MPGCDSEKHPVESSIECTVTLCVGWCMADLDPVGEQGEQLEEGDVSSSRQFKLYLREKVAAVVDQSLKNFKMATLGH